MTPMEKMFDSARALPSIPRVLQEVLATLNKKDGTAVTDWSWTCQVVDTCWNKFHNFYQPQGLFNTNFCLESSGKVKFSNYAYASTLYKKKYDALGIKIKRQHRRNTTKHTVDNNFSNDIEEDINVAQDIEFLQQSSDSNYEDDEEFE